MQPLATVSNALVLAVLEGAPVSAAASAASVASAGLSLEALRDVTGRSPLAAFATLWAGLLAASGDDLLGLAIGDAVPGSRFGLAARAASAGGDAGSVLARLATYAPLVNSLLECRLEHAGPRAALVVRFHWDVDDLERHAVDLTFASVAAWARAQLAAGLAIREVRVTHTRANAQARYERHFGAPAVLGAARNELVFDAAALALPIVDPDPELAALLAHYASQELAKLPVVTGLPDRVAQLIRDALAAGAAPDLAAIAASVTMSSRRLQRRLAEHGTTFSALRDAARRQLAPTWLAAPDATVEHVGARLGYAEPTAFIRAFKKWYGETPGARRRRG